MPARSGAIGPGRAEPLSGYVKKVEMLFAHLKRILKLEQIPIDFTHTLRV